MINFLSGTAGLIIIVIDLAFAVWAGIGKVWYAYPLNFILLFMASSAINTSYIQGLTRGVSCIYLYEVKGISKAFRVNIPTIVFMLIAYFITCLVFSIFMQKVLFFGACIVLSTIVAFVDNQFQIAIDRTKAFESMPYINPKKIQWCKTCKYFKKIKGYKEKLFKLWLSEGIIKDSEIPCKILNETRELWINYFQTENRERTLYPRNCPKWTKK